jgi:hypothetical protein
MILSFQFFEASLTKALILAFDGTDPTAATLPLMIRAGVPITP